MTVRSLSLAVALAAFAAHAAAQSPSSPAQPAAASPGRLTFEVASIKRNVSGDPNASIRVQPGGQIVVTNNSLYNLIRNAYGTQRYEMVPGQNLPSWIDSDRWDILAKPPENAPRVEEQMQLRLRSLLEDRFKLVARREMREMPIYELVVARSGQLGPRLKQSGDECAAQGRAREAGVQPPPLSPGGFCGTRTGNGSVSMKGVPLSNFVRNLGGMTGRFVIDKTGLTGPYDLDLQWTPDPAAAGGPPPGPPGPGDGASLFAAIQEQLGLKLEAKRAPVEVVVIDSAERPTED
jgi:uncharacterized protein (TIGR03435 family)